MIKNYDSDGSLDNNEITEDELDELYERELTEDEYFDLVILDKAEYSNHEELVFNYKKLIKHVNYCDSKDKKQRMLSLAKNERIRYLEELLEKKNTDSINEEVEDTEGNDEQIEPFYADYLRQGYKIIMPRQGVGTMVAEDKEGNSRSIAKIDGYGDWRDNPPRKEHNVIEETPTHLIVAITEEYDDGSIVELKRYEIVLEGENT